MEITRRQALEAIAGGGLAAVAASLIEGGRATYQDAENYYVVRANALEGNVVLYKVENGKRSDLKPTGAWPLSYGKKAQVPSGQWSTLGVVARGARFEVHLNGEHLFDVEDTTFGSAGKVGLWTKADSVTAFDDFTIEPLDDRPAGRHAP